MVPRNSKFINVDRTRTAENSHVTRVGLLAVRGTSILFSVYFTRDMPCVFPFVLCQVQDVVKGFALSFVFFCIALGGNVGGV